MNGTFRQRLQELQARFTAISLDLAGLNVDLLMAYSRRAQKDRVWRSFVETNGEPTGARWDFFPRGEMLGLFSGNLNGYDRFKGLAGDAYSLFCETDETLDATDGHHGWLRILYDIALNCPTSAINYETWMWGHVGPADHKVIADLNDLLGRHKGVVFPSHPFQLRFSQCLFGLSAAALQLFLAPHAIEFRWQSQKWFRIAPWQLSVVISNTAILERGPAEIARSGLREVVMRMFSLADRLDVPWFIQRSNYSGRLKFGDVEAFVRAGSTGLCRILQEFEDQGWPPAITNPFGDSTGAAEVGRDFERKMQGHAYRLLPLKFKARNSGKRIEWEAIEPKRPITAKKAVKATKRKGRKSR